MAKQEGKNDNKATPSNTEVRRAVQQELEDVRKAKYALDKKRKVDLADLAQTAAETEKTARKECLNAINPDVEKKMSRIEAGRKKRDKELNEAAEELKFLLEEAQTEHDERKKAAKAEFDAECASARAEFQTAAASRDQEFKDEIKSLAKEKVEAIDDIEKKHAKNEIVLIGKIRKLEKDIRDLKPGNPKDKKAQRSRSKRTQQPARP